MSEEALGWSKVDCSIHFDQLGSSQNGNVLRCKEALGFYLPPKYISIAGAESKSLGLNLAKYGLDRSENGAERIHECHCVTHSHASRTRSMLGPSL